MRVLVYLGFLHSLFCISPRQHALGDLLVLGQALAPARHAAVGRGHVRLAPAREHVLPLRAVGVRLEFRAAAGRGGERAAGKRAQREQPRARPAVFVLLGARGGMVEGCRFG